MFSIYVLMLAVYPCADQKTCVDEQRTGTVANMEMGDHNHSESETDLCSPFCFCSCCAASIRLTIGVVVPNNYRHNTIHTIPYTDRPLLSNSHAIWQPPRLS